MQDRNPCSGCGRERRMISTSAAVSSPIAAGLSLDPLMRPVAITPVRTRHVFGDRGRTIRALAARMGRHQLAAMEDLHRLRRDAHVHLFAQQPERHRVEMLLDLDVVIEIDPAALPVRIFIRRRRQRHAARGDRVARTARAVSCPSRAWTVIELADQLADRLVQLGQGEEPLVAQPGEDPALHDLDADLDLRLVARLVRPRRNHRRAVMRRHVGVGSVDRRLVEAGLGDPGT